eukprot:gnl/Ergobibamus_cyprinoides/1308.p3 GENE.gnl/Ergobibamus_cyprinoides/1308~~gnl/Ergobibamus_cyprinoides/1308.p3  ORF type:complete len:104 (+),score=8.55 gnl/Ergobibamus_cyprinoides/1308:304-615(+)
MFPPSLSYAPNASLLSCFSRPRKRWWRRSSSPSRQIYTTSSSADADADTDTDTTVSSSSSASPSPSPSSHRSPVDARAGSHVCTSLQRVPPASLRSLGARFHG